MLIDIAGASLLAAWLFALLSMTVLRDDSVADEIRSLKRSIAETSRSLAVAQSQLDRSRDQLHSNRELLRERGKLPDTAPVDEYFQFLSGIADRHELSILSQIPIGDRTYPGLRERRFAYTISGSLPRIVAFFRDVESSSYWADIGYLTIHPSRVTGSTGAAASEAQLTICLFSAKSAGTDDGDEG